MPLYVFRCPAGHVSELVRPLDAEETTCSCGAPAERQHVPTAFDVVGPTVDSRGMFRRFREAGYDIERAYEKQGLPSPSFYPEAKQEAVAMARAGEARFRPERARK